jgi:hypothetical protein
MEQSQAEPREDSQAKTQRVYGRPFLPGNNANPLGRGTAKQRVAAEVEALTTDFRNVHGRDPTPAEASRLASAADFRTNAKRALSIEDKVKSSNAAERMLRKLGLDRPVRTPSTTPSVPLPTGYEPKARK